jgi:AcrR family transcriptional regulator
MTTPRNPTRQRLVDAALTLFAQQGITETATKQIAELAEVNEVTLFRQFGNKQGLVLAILEESAIFDRLADSLSQPIAPSCPPDQVIRQYVQSYLRLLDGVPELLRSLIGEAGKSPIENKEALGWGIKRANQALAEYLGAVGSPLNSDRIVSLINSTLLGYAVLTFTTEFHGLWPDRESFVEDLVKLVLSQPIASSGRDSSGRDSSQQSARPIAAPPIADLPAPLVHRIFQRAQKQGGRELALIYLLFGAGVSPAEIIHFERVHYFSDRDAQFLQIVQGAVRQVPVNQWIMGKRYGSYQKNPLTQWLKGRKDAQSALFLNAQEEPLTVTDIVVIWRELTTDLVGWDGQPPILEQAQQTWCVEMLMRGISLADMQILSGRSLDQLAPYGKRAKEKAVLEQGLALDKPR